MTSFHDFTAPDINGNQLSLGAYKGKTVIVVNVASKCGLTPHYKGLEDLYKRYKDKGVVVLGFPCNQFGAQEPGTEKEIQQFCSLNYDVTFPLFSKVDVNGEKTHPVYAFLKSALKDVQGKEDIKWNFTKFLIDKNGIPQKRYEPQDEPSAIEKDLL